MILTETQIDIIKELFNRGVGKAAEIISEMLSSEIILSVPQLTIGSPKDILNDLSSIGVTGVRQSFTGEYYGDAMILYGYQSCLEVIGALLGYEEMPQEFGHFERETLSEFGNIILSSCLYEFESALGCKLSTGAPLVINGKFPQNFIGANNIEPEEIMTLNMKFSLSKAVSTGRISLILNPNDLKDMAPKLDAYMERILAE